MKNLFKNKKAVSPVVATVLMILVTMIGMTLLFAFVSSYSENYKAGIGSSVMESLTVEDIWLSPDQSGQSTYDTEVVLSIYNVGKVESKINSVYVNGLKLTDTNTGQNFNLEKDVLVGAHESITLYRQNNWQSGEIYTFRITTLRGSNFDVPFQAP